MAFLFYILEKIFIMAADINALLALPKKERRQIAEKLWDSLAPETSIAKEDEATLQLLEKRWMDIESGKSKLYSSTQMKQKIEQYRIKK